MTFERNPNNSSEFLTMILQNMNVGIISCDTDFKITFTNLRIQEIYGIPPGAPSEDWARYIQIFEADGTTPVPIDQMPLMRAMRGEKVIDSYNVIVSTTKGRVLVKNNAHPIFDGDGKIAGAILTTEDSQDLAKTLSRFKAIFYQSPLSIQILDKAGNTVLVNEAFKKLWAIPEDFIQNYILTTYNILEDAVLEEAGTLDLIKRAFQGEIVHIPEFYYDPITKGFPGHPRWAAGTVYPLKNSKGEVSEVVVIHEDFTDKRAAVNDRDKTLAQLEAIVRQMPAGVMVMDTKEELLLYNAQMTKLLGDSTTAKEVFRPSIDRSFKGEILNSEEIQLQELNGQVSVFDTSSGPVHDNAGNIFASILIAKDITHEKVSEIYMKYLANVKSLLISTLDFDQTLESIANSAIPFLADGCIVDLLDGPDVKRIVLKHKDPFLRSALEELKNQYPPRPGAPHPSLMAMKSGQPVFIKNVTEADLKHHTFDEHHESLVKLVAVTSLISIPLVIRGKTIGVFTIVNSKERSNFTENDFEAAKQLAYYASLSIENAALYRDAKSAVKLRDDFISIASHELRTPITSLQLQVQVLSSLVAGFEIQSEATQMMRKFLGSTHSQLKRLTRLVDDMLDISRIDTGKLSLNIRKINLTGLALDVLDRFKEQTEAQKIHVEFTSICDVYCECDPERIDQVITNFMTNAIRYGRKNPIHIHLTENEKNVIFKIIDHGRGIEKSDQQRIFKRFEQAHTSEDVNGLGLGLYINQRIIEEHGGLITLESEIGKGSTFIVLLPKTVLENSATI